MNGNETAPTLFDDPYPPGLYRGLPPSEPRDTAGTSAAAAVGALPNANAMRSRVLVAIRDAGGCTDDEVERLLGLRHQTVSARRRELVLLGLVHDSTRRRQTSSGRQAVVWETIE